MTDNGNNKGNRVVLVTGFGPFAGHPKNASWEAVKELKNSDLEDVCNVTMVTMEVPVAYESVSHLIPKLWLEHKPMLVVHIGVSGMANCLELECRAHGSGYNKLDVFQSLPTAENELLEDPGEVIETGINVKRICDELNCRDDSISSNDEGCRAVLSKDAGLYLCEYIFRKSLEIRSDNTIFVHVPDLNVYPATKSAKGLYHVIRLALEELDAAKN
ncbi:pyroglutamyl-peptidase 1 [Neodiprion lecontei]|uniref:Pyroglutamyl-peptidase 1 n=1 Tax=Neodiprion lecontei TaxID=441921 RepID=A0A6J0BED5_NEOLC|nr:pyroglutamyl-peptidase 1 [Neodiprion lecontei]XP_015512751.1 pyroglutamyl-peptidase 1 [Neodiprion lecontei]